MEHADHLDRSTSPWLDSSGIVAFNRAELATFVDPAALGPGASSHVRVAVQTTSGPQILGVSPHDGNPDETARRVWGLLVREGVEPGAAYDVYAAVSEQLAAPIEQPFTLDVTVRDDCTEFELKMN